MSDSLRIQSLSLAFGGLQVLDGASLEFPAGRITGLIGPNGAGKTTLFNCISGLLRPGSGHVLFGTREITGLAPEAVAATGIARTFQLARGFPRMSVYEHLMVHGQDQPGERFFAALLGTRSVRQREAALEQRARSIAARLKLSAHLDAPITALSGGQKKLLEIGRALMAAPRLILLDEPMAGINPTLRYEIASHLMALRDEGITVALIEHDMALIESVCDSVCVMAGGRLLAAGRFDELSANTAVQDAYLGVRQPLPDEAR